MMYGANCKINLGLNVVRKREDGYHELETVMLPVVRLMDIVEVDVEKGIKYRSIGNDVDCPVEDNLCVRAARLMEERYKIYGAGITLEKCVPFGAGLGGGSSDATAVIRGINDIYNLRLDKAELSALASELGSDAPFFVYNRPMLCTGRGEIMTPIDVDLSGLWIVVAKPSVSVSTAEAYRGVTPAVPSTPLAELLKRPIEEWQGSVKNDFEPHIFAVHPEIKAIKDKLLDAGALYASMSGSGSAVFGLFREQPAIEFADDIFVHIEQITQEYEE